MIVPDKQLAHQHHILSVVHIIATSFHCPFFIDYFR